MIAGFCCSSANSAATMSDCSIVDFSGPFNTQGFYKELQLEFSSLQPQELANVAWALGALNQQPPGPWLHEFMCRVQRRLGQCESQHLAMLLWACARWRVRPSGGWLSAWLKEKHVRLNSCCMQVRYYVTHGVLLQSMGSNRLSDESNLQAWLYLLVCA